MNSGASDPSAPVRGFAYLSPPAEHEWLPEDDEGTSCLFCGRVPAVWAHRLDPADLTVPGRGGLSVGAALLTCEHCAELFARGNDAELVQRACVVESAGGDPRQDAAEEFRGMLTALHAATSGRRRLSSHVEPPETAELRAAGFEPLDGFTGIADLLGPLWPIDHARSFPDVRRYASPVSCGGMSVRRGRQCHSPRSSSSSGRMSSGTGSRIPR